LRKTIFEQVLIFRHKRMLRSARMPTSYGVRITQKEYDEVASFPHSAVQFIPLLIPHVCQPGECVFVSRD